MIEKYGPDLCYITAERAQTQKPLNYEVKMKK